MASPPLVELRGITQEYTTGRRVHVAVEAVHLQVREGEFMALLGPSGCGKSTLLRIITGLQVPSRGEVVYRGAPFSGVNPHATIVFQTFALFPWLTVQENVELALKARGVPPKLRTLRAVELLDRVGLDGFETAYPRELSGGMRQKVGFARAMAVEPELLCLDEPFSALDVLSAGALRGELLELWLGGKIPTRAILLVTHNIEEAVLMADRLLVMATEPGRVAAEITVDLPHPRDHKAAAFTALVDRVYATLAGQTREEPEELGSAPGEPGRTRRLPHVAIADLSGLLEHLSAAPGDRADLYQLAADLKLDADHLIELTESSELFGFATIRDGAITLTSLGETFAEASILARKEIFATRMRRLPLVRWLVAMLGAAERRSLRHDVVLAALELEFPPEEAARQLDALVNWGRYAEILAYDQSTTAIYLESRAA
ncbi:MAG: AAA-associated domain-containing protein [Thermoanaerobaculaceae bacterium]|nr:AAA-associated domain-containing protein [Thermoanaerobaculaceae bacterium]MDI9622689.1 nitrate/sulfonate/bicarbonate ABC transporter ATP-binding protein [Acidobacteriota bacterium]NLH11013.1 ATP-binding cassette domain-containing protein [Holophagae bacterium]HPW55026.1 nitrate/sulfonate/bicarbonate ABC transporter ATP-binding protein [Thermoanaerobaculaceae bacterium]